DYFENATTNESCCAAGYVCDPTNGQEFKATFILVLYLLAFVVGVVGNGLLLLVLVQNRRTWSVTDTFILHLAMADVLLLVTLPTWAAQAAQDEGWTFGTPLCKITGAVFMVNFYCGIFLLGCISFDRYLSIVHATHMYSHRKPWAIRISCMAAWLFSLLLSITDLVFLEAVSNDRLNRTMCVRNYLMFTKQSEEFTAGVNSTQVNWQLSSRLIYHIVGFLLPSAVMIFCYTCILRRLRCSSQGLQKQRAIRVIIAVVAVFFLCWTPYNIVLLVDTFYSPSGSDKCGMHTSMEKALTVTSSVGYLHCSLNPILYAFVGVKFRRQLLAVLRSLGCKLKTTTRLHSTASSRRSSFWSESAETSKSV
ncbi:unnamed protein product, partial [Tetraodon nigroviridis]